MQDLALKIFEFCAVNGIELKLDWVPRSQNVIADEISKISDSDNWEISQELFNYLNSLWGPFQVDRFASYENHKLGRFYTRHWTPGTAGVNALAYDWGDCLNWWVPPVRLVSSTLRHIVACRARGTLIVPCWKSALFWPLLIDSAGYFDYYVITFLHFRNAGRFLVRNRCSRVFNEKYQGNLLALCIDASRDERVMRVRFH